MSPKFQHPLQILTLATWLTVLPAGIVGLLLRPDQAKVEALIGEVPGVGQMQARLTGAYTEDGGTAPSVTDSVPTLAAAEPPALPELADLGPLPDLPQPRAATGNAAGDSQEPAADSPQPKPSSRTAGVGRPAERPRASVGGSNAGSGDNDRLAKGSMPRPTYPSEAQRRGQQGTVVVEFTIDASGRVIDAEAVEPSRWPLLNREALRAVRRWKFPPGDVMKVRRPIVFQIANP